MYQISENKIRLSVRGLVEFVLKSGDIDNRKRSGKDAMQEGSRIHRMIQKRMGSGYRAEVSLNMTVALEKYVQELRQNPGIFPYAIGEDLSIDLALDGRADGIVDDEAGILIDEIKGTYQRLDHIEVPEAVHVAQAVCYGYMYTRERRPEQVTIQVTYCNMDSEEIRQFQEVYSFPRLEEEFCSYLREYTRWAAFLICHRQVRNASLQGMEFPFPYRKGQKDLVVSVYRSIVREKTLFIQAPTGIGKTLSTIFPSVKAVGEGKLEKIFYLTAKTIARTVAEESMTILRGQGMELTALTITAKEKMCPMSRMECNPVACPMAKGYFERVNEAVYDLICHEKKADRTCILAYAEKHQVCPFEFTLDLSYWMDAVICDYNYVFDPNVYLQRYFADGERGAYVFLVDEAHNMVDRAREMYSATLYKEQFLEAKRLYVGYEYLTKKLSRCSRQMLTLKRECEHYQVLEPEELSELVRTMELIFTDLQEFADRHPDVTLPPEAGEFFFTVRDFLRVYEALDENYTVYGEMQEDGRFMVRLYCVNPASNLQQCMARGKSTVYFSATLLPIQYYRRLLSGRPEDYAVYVPSPFPEENRLLCISQDVTSKYTRRGSAEYRRIATYIRHILTGMKGNYLVFFPSYQFLESVKEAFLELCETEWGGSYTEETIFVEQPEKKEVQAEAIPQTGQLALDLEENSVPNHTTWSMDQVQTERQMLLSGTGGEQVADTSLELELEEVQSVVRGLHSYEIAIQGNLVTLYEQNSHMSESERHAFLEQFCEGGDCYRLGFCVIGGSFSEGIDLANDRLIGVIVVGTGLPQVCTERELLKRHFDRTDGSGFAFAYLYPGMNKVLQAAGRLVRTPEDVGIIALLDERFHKREYMDLFPAEWSRYLPVTADTVGGAVQDFWLRL